MPPRLGVVIPCYNEEAVLPETRRHLAALLDRLVADEHIAADSRVYFVDDGSRDATWRLIEQFSTEDKRFGGIKLSRNCGHQRALLAGLLTAEGDLLVSLDADLQDDPTAVIQMLAAWREGHEIVFGVRDQRDTDTAFKRLTAQGFYRVMSRMGVDLVYDHADYRLMTRRAVECLREYGEVNLFLRGIIPQIGFRTTTVRYVRHERFAGESKYPLRKMLALAIDGITSFSVVPLRLISMLGLATCGLSLAMVAWIFYGHLVLDSTVPGWASTVVPTYFLGGVQLLSIGILGEYIAKIYLETKQRPRYFVERVL
ncbi:glycosyltransferase [Azoarcus sp. DD4]|uniref:glycosyltransferase family 2 protein n=1 Tax=Azoarcus sp. DD4 TaxID=2027405 RepID=UPI0011271012|nr:glycosyltransferase family 2 protein [Azoarcus sp. DD4]QDF98657.1 glycosyltransferase [Azoarcus sp. DD4]